MLLSRKTPTPRKLNLVYVERLAPGDHVRIGGRPVHVARLQRSSDGYHWRIYVEGVTFPIIVPPGARFTRVAP